MFVNEVAGQEGDSMCHTVQCSAVQCSTVQYSAVQCSAVQYSTVQCSAVQCSAVQCSAVQCSAVQCSAVQCSTAFNIEWSETSMNLSGSKKWWDAQFMITGLTPTWDSRSNAPPAVPNLRLLVILALSSSYLPELRSAFTSVTVPAYCKTNSCSYVKIITRY